MNELEFRQNLMINSLELTKDMQSYLLENPRAKKWVKEQRSFEESLSKVISVKVPESLEERILLQQSFNQKPSNNADWLQKWGYFATSFTLVAVIFSFWLNTETPPYSSPEEVYVMQEGVIDHIFEHVIESESLAKSTSLPQTKSEMQLLFAKVGAKLHTPVSSMKYVGECIVNGKKALHLVLQEGDSIVTIIIMPNERLTAMKSFEQLGQQGQLIPVVGGVVAIVGYFPEKNIMAQYNFFKSVDFG